MKSRKAQGMPLNVIIIAVLVVLVMLVVIFIFGGGIGKFRTGMTTCEGTCSGTSVCTEPSQTAVYMPGCKIAGQTTAKAGDNYCCTAGDTGVTKS